VVVSRSGEVLELFEELVVALQELYEPPLSEGLNGLGPQLGIGS